MEMFEFIGLPQEVTYCWKDSHRFAFIVQTEAETPVEALCDVLLKAYVNGVPRLSLTELMRVDWSRPQDTRWTAFKRSERYGVRDYFKSIGMSHK